MTTAQSPLRPTLARSVVLGIALMVALLSIGAAVNYRNISALNDTAALVAHTHQVEELAADVHRVKADLVTAQRRLLLLRAPPTQAAYENLKQLLPARLQALRTLTRDNPEQAQRLTGVAGTVATLIAALDAGVAQLSTDTAEVAAYIASDSVQQHVHEIRSGLQAIRDEEAELLFERERELQRTYRLALASALASLVLGLAVFAGVGELIRRHFVAREREQALLFAEQEQLAVTLASIGDGVIATDRSGRVSTLNRAAESLIGWSRQDATGKPLADVLPLRHPDSREPLETPVSQVLSSGQVITSSQHALLTLRDGRERALADSAAPIRNAGGTITGAVLVLRDVEDERRELLAALRRSQRQQTLADLALQLQGASEVAATLELVTQGALRLLTAREAETLLCSSDDWSQAARATAAAQGSELHWLTPPTPAGDAIRNRIRLTNRPLRLSAAAWAEELDGRALLAGRTQPVGGCVAVPLTDRHGHNQGLIQLCGKLEGEFTLEDEALLVQLATLASVSIERSRLHSELREADRRKDHFLAMLAHELRNPLSAISGGSQLLALQPDQPAVVSETAALMLRQCTQLKQMVDDLLDVSRISQGKLNFQVRPVRVQDVLQSAVDVARPLIEAAGHVLELQIVDAPLYVRGDPVRLSQVVANLLVNAAKYTPAGGRIELRLAGMGGAAEIEVTDNGVGIPPEQLSEIFELFTQIDSSRARSQGGLGIGLTLARTLVQMHDGQISAQSLGAGQGSTFRVRLPLARLTADELRQFQPPLALPGPLAVRRILLVDDNRTGILILTRLLSSLEQRVQAADTCAEALRLQAEFQPDIVISDIAMPDMSGYDLARQIRDLDPQRRTVLVALTGFGQPTDRDAAFEAGFDHHLTKPVSLDQLVSLLQTIGGSGLRPQPSSSIHG